MMPYYLNREQVSILSAKLICNSLFTCRVVQGCPALSFSLPQANISRGLTGTELNVVRGCCHLGSEFLLHFPRCHFAYRIYAYIIPCFSTFCLFSRGHSSFCLMFY